MRSIPASWRLPALAATIAAVGLLAASGPAAARAVHHAPRAVHHAPRATGNDSSRTSPPTTPASGSVSLSAPGLFEVGGHQVSIPDRRTTVVGGVTPYVAGQTVVLTLSLNGKAFETRQLTVRSADGGSSGSFEATYKVPGPGQVSISATHAATAGQDAFSGRLRYASLKDHARPGTHSRFVLLIQQRLAQLHFYVPRNGVYGVGTEWAIDAYHRLLRRGYSDLLNRPTVTALLDGVGRFHVRFRHQGRHAEGDLSDQVLALIDGSKVKLLLPISSGKPSTPTILGSYRIYSRVPGYLPDGMYYSDFFIRGYAIHGYDPAPNYPASHGCLRLPIGDAITVYHWLAIGDWVDTYYR